MTNDATRSSGTGALLALAIAIAGWVNALQLAWLLRRSGV